MPFEFEALVGYLYVVGGRSISAPPPGTLVEIAPKRTLRARDLDTVFALVLPSGGTVAPAAFYEEMARAGADGYFNSTGTVTSGIKTVFTKINANLVEHNATDPRHYEASMFLGVLRGSDLYVGKVGAGVGLFYKDGSAQPFPTDFSYREGLQTPPLGVQTDPEIRMGRYQVSHGTRLLLADAALLEYSMDALTSAIGQEDIGAALSSLREGAIRQLTAMAVEFVTPETQVRLPVKSGDSTAAITGNAAAAPEPDAEGAVPTDASAASRRSSRRGQFLRNVAAGLAGFGARIVDAVLRLLDRMIPTPPNGKKSWLTSPAAAGVALLLPVLIVVLVILFWVSNTGVTAFDQCIDRANTTAETARAIDSADVSGRMAGWNAVLAVTVECDQLRPNDPVITAMSSEARAALDQMQNITRRDVTPIYTFPNAMLTQAVLQGLDMYVLDSANQQVYRITLATDGMSVIPDSYAPIPAMRRSGKVVNFDISDLIDIAWADNGAGLASSNVIVALDKNGVLIACPPRFLQDCSAQKLPGAETWKTPTAIQFWSGRLYLLDPGANQIWRYDPVGGAFSGLPLEVFSGTNRPDITSAMDFAIHTGGDIYILTKNGVLARFRGGEQQDFAFSNFDTERMNAPTGMFMNTNPIAQGFFFAERDQRTIFETTMAGTLTYIYHAENDDRFAQLSNAVADTNLGLVYALSGNTIFAFQHAQ